MAWWMVACEATPWVASAAGRARGTLNQGRSVQ
jgi:hypothetical protein